MQHLSENGFALGEGVFLLFSGWFQDCCEVDFITEVGLSTAVMLVPCMAIFYIMLFVY